MEKPPTELGITKRLWAFAILSILLFFSLAIAPLRDYFSEWRLTQWRYNRLAQEEGAPPIDVKIRQLWRPEMNVTDRCTSCHLGMGPGEPLQSDKLFSAHPPLPHDPDEIGCTVCHAGQGRATNKEDAHGDVKYWEEPLIKTSLATSGCGTCHSHIPIPNQQQAAIGEALFSRGCLDCHRIDGQGRGDGPDLSYVGLRPIRRDWYQHHLSQYEEQTAGFAASFVPLTESALLSIDEFFKTRTGAPKLFAAKSLAFQLGCRGCHKINGVGGDDGPDLSDIGRKSGADLDYSGVAGEHTLANWLVEHFIDPARVVPGSQMPDLSLTQEQATSLTLYMLSLRQRLIPENIAPRDRVKGARLGERDFSTDGASLYGVFCSACHGDTGQGRRFASSNSIAFPSVGNPDFLALASDNLLRQTLLEGRPGRRMPAWGTKDGGLRLEEIDSLTQYLRGLQPDAPSLEEVQAATPNEEHGKMLFYRDCVPCHGSKGEGTVIGPPLATKDNQLTRDNALLYSILSQGSPGTAMGSYRTYSATELRSVIGVVVNLSLQEGSRVSWFGGIGSALRGETLYGELCAGCHGAKGEGKEALAVANPALLNSASDGYLIGTIIRGRRDTSMPSFGRGSSSVRALDAQEVLDIVAFIRSLASKVSLR